MNDRFVKLAYQAKLFDGTGTVPFEYVAKFAELIVQECALQCIHNEDMDLIEKHFGVEE